MSKTNKTPNVKFYIFFILMIIPPISFFAALPWLRVQQDNVVYFWGGLASIITVLSSLALAIHQDRRMDEWLRTGTRFSVHWGYVAGCSFLAMMLALPQGRDLIVHVATQLSRTGQVDDKLVLLSFTGGFIACVFVQMVFIAIIGAIWRAWSLRAV